jgi:hypothetical protein
MLARPKKLGSAPTSLGPGKLLDTRKTTQSIPKNSFNFLFVEKKIIKRKKIASEGVDIAHEKKNGNLISYNTTGHD